MGRAQVSEWIYQVQKQCIFCQTCHQMLGVSIKHRRWKCARSEGTCLKQKNLWSC